MTYDDQHDNPIEFQVHLSEQFGDDTCKEIEAALEERVVEARGKGILEKGARPLHQIFKKHLKVFVINLDTNQPANIKRFEIELKPGA